MEFPGRCTWQQPITCLYVKQKQVLNTTSVEWMHTNTHSSNAMKIDHHLQHMFSHSVVVVVIFSIIPMLQMQSAVCESVMLSATAFHWKLLSFTYVCTAVCIQSNLLFVLSLSPLLSLIWFDSWLFLFLSLFFGAALCFVTGLLCVCVYLSPKTVFTVCF